MNTEFYQLLVEHQRFVASHPPSPFAAGVALVFIRAIAEGRDFETDLDVYLTDYQAGMVFAGIKPAKARATLLELRALVMEELNASRLAQARVVDNTLTLG